MRTCIRRGLLSTLFAGGLLALGTTAANAADINLGSDPAAAASVSAGLAANSTSLGLLGDSTTSGSATVEAVAQVAVGGSPSGSGGTGLAPVATEPVAAAVYAAVDLHLGQATAPAPAPAPAAVTEPVTAAVDAAVDLNLGQATAPAPAQAPAPAAVT